MKVFKRLLFAPIFLITLFFFFYFFNLYIKSETYPLATNPQMLFQFALLSGLALLSSLFFILFAILTQDWKLAVPVFALIDTVPLLFGLNPLNYLLAGGCFTLHCISYFLVDREIEQAVDFKPEALLSPPVKKLASFLIILISIGYFLTTNIRIQEKGFQIPDTLADTVLKMAPIPQATDINTSINQYSLEELSPTKDQVRELKNNPELLKQFGLEPEMLDQIKVKQMKQPKRLINEQIQKLIDPYIQYISLILALIFYASLQFILNILSFLVSPLITLIFILLEKFKVISYVITTKEVRKMKI